MRIKNKLKQSGFRGLLSTSVQIITNIVKIQYNHQELAHKVLSRYTSFEGKEILEVGGAQSCDSAIPFLKDGAARAIITGLDHITQEKVSDEYNLRIMQADALELSKVFEPMSFDVVYGLSVVEHIPSPKTYLEEVFTILKPGGLAYFEGNPIWTSPKGHHLWVSTWGGGYKNKATANYLFSPWPGEPSTNPLPDWSHLLMTADQMRKYLSTMSIPDIDVDCIIDWVYNSGGVNRIGMTEIAEAYSNSMLVVLEANTIRVDVPHEVQADLQNRYGDGIDFGISGVTYVLKKPLS